MDCVFLKNAQFTFRCFLQKMKNRSRAPNRSSMPDSGSFRHAGFWLIAVLAFFALAASVADYFHAAGLTAFSEIRLIQLFFFERITPFIREPEFHFLSLKAQSGAESLIALQTVAFQLVDLSVFYEQSSGSAEDKSDVVSEAFVV